MTLNALVNFTLNRIESLYFIYREEEGRQRTLNYRLIFFLNELLCAQVYGLCQIFSHSWSPKKEMTTRLLSARENPRVTTKKKN